MCMTHEKNGQESVLLESQPWSIVRVGTELVGPNQNCISHHAASLEPCLCVGWQFRGMCIDVDIQGTASSDPLPALQDTHARRQWWPVGGPTEWSESVTN